MTLQEWMEREGTSVQLVADLMGVDVALVRSWASGRSIPTFHERQMLAHITRGAVSVTSWAGDDPTPSVFRRGR